MSSDTRAPYGPATPAIRRFLVQLAGLGSVGRRDVVTRFTALARTPEFASAEQLLGETIERSGRTDARDALAGPLLQLVSKADATPVDDNNDDDDALLDQLDPIAEPALAAALALLVRDLLPPAAVQMLYAPFAEIMPLDLTP